MAATGKPFLDVLRGETRNPPPVWFMRQAGRYLPEYRELRTRASGFLDFCYTPDLTVEATLQPLRRFDFDAAILFSDILVIPDALGQTVDFREGEGPVLEPLRSDRDIAALTEGRIRDHLAPVFETLRRLSEAIPPTTALIGFAGAPWTVATYMIEGRGGTDFSTARSWFAKDPTGFQVLIDILVEATADYLIAQAENGAEALQLFDTWAGILDDAEFESLVVEPTREILRRVWAVHPEIQVIGFPRGAGERYVGYVERTGVCAIGIDSEVDPAWAAKALQGRCAVQGNLDPNLLIAGGREMRRAVRRILDDLSEGPFIFNLGHGIMPPTPIEHVSEVLAMVRGE